MPDRQGSLSDALLEILQSGARLSPISISEAEQLQMCGHRILAKGQVEDKDIRTIAEFAPAILHLCNQSVAEFLASAPIAVEDFVARLSMAKPEIDRQIGLIPTNNQEFMAYHLGAIREAALGDA